VSARCASPYSLSCRRALGGRYGWTMLTRARATSLALIAASTVGLCVLGASAAGGAPRAIGRGALQRQLIVVSSAAYRESYATLTAYDVSGQRRRVAFGPWTARIGSDGFAPPGQKREGDGRTPSGSYGFGFMFGVLANPGVRFAYRRVERYDVWDDDPASPLYNEWIDEHAHSPGAAPELMDQTPAYDYGAVIAYNEARVPGRGSAIFLHVGGDAPTAGCVSLPVGELVDVLRWLNPGATPEIEMGVAVARRA
jgi:L,D-peptidoglycan transpeptidase YkuD (ErfK/YbiS/YcfS/YnhG family)